MAFSTRRLGVGYLGTTAFLLGSALLVRLAVGTPPLLATVTGVGSTLALGYAGYWLAGSPLDDDRVWAVATWGGAGIGVVTLASLAVMAGPVPAPGIDVLVSNVAAGGLVGVLIGGIRELNRELERTARLHEQNAVLNRVLRHNVRNDMNVVLGYVDTLESRFEEPIEGLDVIRDRAASIADLAAKARRAEAAVASGPAGGRVDVAAVVDRRATVVNEAHPEAEVAVDLPDEAPAAAGDAVDVIVRNLLENAIEHSDGPAPEVCVTVRREPRSIEVRVADDGEPIPEVERRALADGEESALDHGSGMGLWLVKWLVERYDGDLAFETPADGGTVVRVRVPRADDGPLPFTGNAFPLGQSV